MSLQPASATSEAENSGEQLLIEECLLRSLHWNWDGRSCVDFLESVSNHGAQSNWEGFYFEHAARLELIREIQGEEGPSFGRMNFDYARTRVWDFKVHANKNRKNNTNQVAILNDSEAIDSCLRVHGSVGFIIASGLADWDEDGSLKRYQQSLRGGPSAYSKRGIEEGRKSRIRKSRMVISHLHFLEFRSLSAFNAALDEGWVAGGMQKGMRNSNNKPRRSKYALHVSRLPEEVATSETLWKTVRVPDPDVMKP